MDSTASTRGQTLNVALTGGTGFLGAALVRLMVREGASVRVLVRRSQADGLVHALGAECVRGDVVARGGCANLVRPGDVVIHTVARVDLKGRWREFRELTIEGTRRLLDSALPQQPSRFVYVSSAGVYGASQVRHGVSADRVPARPARYNLYGRAKLEAENLVRRRCEQCGCEWTIVRLGATYGPGKRALLTHFQPMLREGHIRILGAGTNAIAALFVDDAARAVWLAATHRAAARRIYDVANDERVTQRQWFDATADALDAPRPRRRVPRSVAFAAAAATELLSWVHGCEPAFNRAMVDLISTEQLLDASRIRNELGWRPEVAFEEGMRRTREWYLQVQRTRRAGPDAGSESASERLWAFG